MNFLHALTLIGLGRVEIFPSNPTRCCAPRRTVRAARPAVAERRELIERVAQDDADPLVSARPARNMKALVGILREGDVPD